MGPRGPLVPSTLRTQDRGRLYHLRATIFHPQSAKPELPHVDLLREHPVSELVPDKLGVFVVTLRSAGSCRLTTDPHSDSGKFVNAAEVLLEKKMRGKGLPRVDDGSGNPRMTGIISSVTYSDVVVYKIRCNCAIT